MLQLFYLKHVQLISKNRELFACLNIKFLNETFEKWFISHNIEK